jgi:hypothetical protein
VAHGAVDVLAPNPADPALIRMAGLTAALDRGAVHYVALGDKHSRTAVGESGAVWNSGSPEVTNFDHVEADPGHVLIVDLDLDDAAHPVTVDSRRVGRWRFLTLSRQVDNCRDIADLAVNLDELQDKERTVVQLDAAERERKSDKWERVVVEACKQCGRNRLLDIAPPCSVADLCAATAAGTAILLTDPQAAPLDAAVLPRGAEVIGLVGPEGGFTAEEIAAADCAGARRIGLGPHVLRVETAAVALAARFA